MTVAELIDELQKHNSDTPVQSIAPYSDGGSITPVLPSNASGSSATPAASIARFW